jgi:DSF synthase
MSFSNGHMLHDTATSTMRPFASDRIARVDRFAKGDDAGHERVAFLDTLLQRRAQHAPPAPSGAGRAIDLATLAGCYQEIGLRFEADSGILWCHQRHRQRPCFSQALLAEVLDLQSWLQRAFAGLERRQLPLRYLVWASTTPGIYNLGGDLRLFIELIRAGDAAGLLAYAKACIDICYLNAVSLDLPILTVALIQGDALGGGFEAALSNDLLVAERGCQLGLPEVLFNMFPGMGAYSFLCRRLDGARAKQMILSGRLYAAEELHEMGLIDLLVAPGEGERALREHLDHTAHQHGVQTALARVARRCQPVSYDELIEVTHVWVETALALSEADLRRMERLANAQDRRRARLASGPAPAPVSVAC